MPTHSVAPTERKSPALTGKPKSSIMYGPRMEDLTFSQYRETEA